MFNNNLNNFIGVSSNNIVMIAEAMFLLVVLDNVDIG